MRLGDAPTFLTCDELAAELKRFEYKPGWDLSIFTDVWEGPVFRVTTYVPDAYHPENNVQLRINSRIPPMASAREFRHFVLWRLDQIERHECREWLRFDGKPLYDPHDPIEP
jgi:hypothetical protein